MEVAAVERPDAGSSGDSVVYQIVSPKRPNAPQMGLGGYGKTAEIRTPATPNGCIIRNEGIRPEKAEGRARLIRRIKAYIGTVNLAVRDDSGQLLAALEAHAAAGPCTYEATDEAGNIHRVWIVRDAAQIAKFTAMMAAEPAATWPTEITAAPQLRRWGTKNS